MFINTIKVYLIHFFKFQLKGIKPTRIRVNEIKDNGYSIDLTSGGKSNEGFIRVSKGLKTLYYPNYTRKNSVRVNDYTLNLYNSKV
jgi:hypothetical protein